MRVRIQANESLIFIKGNSDFGLRKVKKQKKRGNQKGILLK